MQREPTVGACLARPVFDHLVNNGHEPERITRVTGVERHHLDRPDIRLPQDRLVALFREAFAQSGDPACQITINGRNGPRAMGAFHTLLLASRNLRELIETACRLHCFLGERDTYSLVEGPATAAFRYTMDTDNTKLTAQQAEANLSAMMAIFREYTRGEFRARQVSFTVRPPRRTRAHEQFFASHLRFDAGHNAIVFDRELLDATREDYQPTRRERLLSQVEGMLREGLGDPFVMDVVARIRAALERGELDINAVSAELHMSRWTLTRRLRRHGTTYQALVDQARRDIARRRLASGEHSISEIAYELGYASPGSFSRAFQGWFQLSPSAYRRTHGPG